MAILEIRLYFTYITVMCLSFIIITFSTIGRMTGMWSNSSSVFPATDWLTSDQSLLIFREAIYHVPNVPLMVRLQTWHPSTYNWAPSDLLFLKTCVRLNLRLIADEPQIGVQCFLYPTDQTPMTIRLKAGESPICLVVGGSMASHGRVAGPRLVGNRNQRKVLSAIGG